MIRTIDDEEGARGHDARRARRGAPARPRPDRRAAAARQLTGVHSSELLDPTPFLSGGELLLTTGLSLPTQTARLPAT